MSKETGLDNKKSENSDIQETIKEIMIHEMEGSQTM